MLVVKCKEFRERFETLNLINEETLIYSLICVTSREGGWKTDKLPTFETVQPFHGVAGIWRGYVVKHDYVNLMHTGPCIIVIVEK